MTEDKKKCSKCPAIEKLGELEKIFGTVDNPQYEEHDE